MQLSTFAGKLKLSYYTLLLCKLTFFKALPVSDTTLVDARDYRSTLLTRIFINCYNEMDIF